MVVEDARWRLRLRWELELKRGGKREGGALSSKVGRGAEKGNEGLKIVEDQPLMASTRWIGPNTLTGNRDVLMYGRSAGEKEEEEEVEAYKGGCMQGEREW